jgi:NodT family efflux transporter outer membrane factor (OMF) lipoprotein
MTSLRALLLAAPLALAACAVGPNYKPPQLPSAGAPQLRETAVEGVAPTPLPAKWWRLFDDPELDRLVERALANNTDLRQAAANLQRARAVVSEARAGRLPTTNATGQYTRQRLGGQIFGAAGAFPVITTDFFTAGFDASYEVDLFGGVSRTIEAARADAAAAQAQVDAARVSVAAETARAYAQACSFALQANVARETQRLQERTLDLTRRLFDGGRGTRRDVAQAEVLVEQARAQVPTFDAERRAALYALAVLTGDPPEQIDAAAARCAIPPAVRQTIPVGDGQSLIARRPDVRAAERTLARDTARVGVATAELYPSISLLGSVTLGSPRIGDLGTSRSFGYSLGPLISWNFPFNGAARARVRQAEATTNASLAAFDGTVLRALQETEQALARLGGAAAREASLARAEASSADAARLTDIRFRAGADNFLQLLESERERANARAALAQARADRADAQISLFKALGGGWEDAPEIAEKRP